MSVLRFLYLLNFIFALCVLNVRGSYADVATDAGFVAHRALYSLHLHSKRGVSPLNNVTGEMWMEWYPDCDSWVSSNKFNLHYEYTELPPSNVETDFVIVERFDGLGMDFNSKRIRDERLAEEISGAAYLDDINADGAVSYDIPRGLSYDLQVETKFPTMHSLGLLDAIKSGKRFYSAPIFDGSDDDGPARVSGFIGSVDESFKQYEGISEIDFSLLESPARKIRLAFFPMNDSSPHAEYEMDMVFHENGIVSDLFIEYSDFSIKQRLIALEKLNKTCDTVE